MSSHIKREGNCPGGEMSGGISRAREYVVVVVV